MPAKKRMEECCMADDVVDYDNDVDEVDLSL